MTESNYWVENYVSSRNAGVHQARKDFEIEVSESVDFNPSIDVYVARGDKMSIQVPKSTKYYKVKRIQEADFLQYFNQTLYRLDHLETSGGEYYINTEDYAKYYELEAFLEASHINITLRINHGADMFDCRMSISHSFSYRPGIRRKYVQLPETTFRQVFNLMLEYCHDRYSKTFPRNTPSFFCIFYEEGTAAAIYDMRRLQYGRCGELREKALLAPDCCLPSLCMTVTL